MYLIFGPLYTFFRGIIVRSLLLILMYVVLIYRGIFPAFKSLLEGWGVTGEHLHFLDTCYDMYWWLLGALAVIHVLMAFIAPRMIVKKLLRKGYVPFSEIDTQRLIKYNLAKVGTLCYLSSFNAVDGVQGKIKMGNSKNLDKELEELKELLKDGMITKDEYETKRAQAMMRSSN
jgi:hypothetical protein